MQKPPHPGDPADLVPLPAPTWWCQILPPRRTEAVGEDSAPCGAFSPRFGEWSVRGEQLGRGGRGDSGSVRSCLIPELTASLFLRQTQHPTVLPPRTDADAPLLHATFRALRHTHTHTHLWLAPLLCVRQTLFAKGGDGGGCGGCCPSMPQAVGIYLLHA